MVVEQQFIEESDASRSVGLSQGSAQENTPSEMPAHRQASRGDSIEHPPLPNEHTLSIVSLQGSNEKPGASRCDQQRQSEQEAAEQRRYRREARELEEQAKVEIAVSLRFRRMLLISTMEAREYEKNQRRMTEVREALLLTQSPVLIETGSGAETRSSEPMSVQTGPSPQISESSNVRYLGYGVLPSNQYILLRRRRAILLGHVLRAPRGSNVVT